MWTNKSKNLFAEGKGLRDNPPFVMVPHADFTIIENGISTHINPLNRGFDYFRWEIGYFHWQISNSMSKNENQSRLAGNRAN